MQKSEAYTVYYLLVYLHEEDVTTKPGTLNTDVREDETRVVIQ